MRHAALPPRCWELRDNVTVYDATYVALAETLDTVLLRADERLTRAPRARCEMRLLRLSNSALASRSGPPTRGHRPQADSTRTSYCPR